MRPHSSSTGMGLGFILADGTAPHSVSDALFESATDCFACEKKFHAFRRKHRCRACGNAVCGNCARTHKVMPSLTIARLNNEPVRVCDGCIRNQNQVMLERRRAEDVERARARQVAAREEIERQREAERAQRERDVAEAQARRELRLRALEEKHLGPRPDLKSLQLRYSRSLDDCASNTSLQSSYSKELSSFIEDAEKRSVALAANSYAADGIFGERMSLDGTETLRTTVVPEAEECAICLETMDVGAAIYTTACGHSFHWSCLKEIQNSDSSNFDKCPSCRTTMTEMQVKKQCDHPRVRLGHRFCRDCGAAVTEVDAKPRADAFGGGVGTAERRMSTPPGSSIPDLNHPVSYRASSHGALVRCPQCHIQMRVLPHMYNMRVACPSGHMFLVQVAGQAETGGGHGGYEFVARGGLAGPRMPPRGFNMRYPGSHYRPTRAYPEL